MRLGCRLLLLNLIASLALADLTMEQKISDFQALASVYAKRYAAYDWKVATTSVDLLDIGTWLGQVQATTNDLDFYEVMIDYLAALDDAHSYFISPANFSANLNFTVDLYDGNLLVDSINTARLPTATFGFKTGYQLVSIDGQDAPTLLNGLLKYAIAGNPRSTRRLAATLLTSRPQSRMPHAPSVPDVSRVVFQRPDGGRETYQIPWTKSGLAMTSVGTFKSPFPLADATTSGEAPMDDSADYMQTLRRLWNGKLPDNAVLGSGSLTPIFAASMPSGFVQRLGRFASDPFYSGVFTANGKNIGFIRIPSFSPISTTTAIGAFQNEIAYLQENTDALVVDVMRNPGGDVSYLNTLLSYLMPSRWTSIGYELRATSEWVAAISSALTLARAQGAPQSTIAGLQSIADAILTANQQLAGRTAAVPLDGVTIDRDPAKDSKGNVIAYTKPIMVLVDEITGSAGDAFAATVQDNARGPLFGWRTMGAGGASVETWLAGSFSQGFAIVPESLMHRPGSIATPDFPPTPYIENVGVRPDIQVDYMTADNLNQRGKPFVDAFVAATIAQLEGH